MGMSFRWYIYGDRADDLLISRLRKLSSEIIYMMGSSFGDTLIIFSSAVCLHHVFRHFSSSSIVSVSV